MTATTGYILFLDRRYSWGPRCRQFGHAVLLEPDIRHPDRWLLRQWRNNREHVRVLFEGDYVDGIGSDTLPMIEAVKRGMLDIDMNDQRDNDVTFIEVRIPDVMPWRPFLFMRASDVGYVKARLGVRSWRIRTPRQLYRFFKEGGADAVEKAPRWSWWEVLRLVRVG